MSKWNWSRASLCAAALILCAISQAQWPQPWNVGVDDRAAMVAVDHRGNVYVTGKVSVAGQGYDYGTISYDAAGNVRWSNTYNYPVVGGDDVPTGIAVDWQGNCYVVGRSYGGLNRGNDFTVVKYDTDGHTVWPVSGSRTTSNGVSYDFDHGALRLADLRSDGIDHNGADVCSIAIKNDPGSQPTFVISGPSGVLTQNGTITKWRTVVFESDLTDGVKIKDGWPVDDFGDAASDTPYGVAIYTDNTVYVTGGVHSDSSTELFETVRYEAIGSNAANPHIWTDSWEEFSGKPSHGVGIALDYIGDAFVTGVLLFDTNTTEIGTRKIERDADLDPNRPPHSGKDDWSTIYRPAAGTSAEPAGISLTFEKEPSAWKTYAYVTGMELESGSSTNHNIPTVRYEGDFGVQQWVDTKGSSGQDDVGYSVAGAGLGNAYVIGRSNNNYTMFALRKAHSDRFLTSYDSGGQDEGRSLALGGAGLAYYTGWATFANKDFLTTRNIEPPTVFVPSDYKVDVGINPTGFGNIGASDDQYFSLGVLFLSTVSSSNTVIFNSTVTTTNPTEISITIEGHVTTNHIWQKVEVFDQKTGSYQLVSDHPAPNGSDENTVIVLKDDPARYMDNTGLVKTKVTYYGNGWSYAVDGPWAAYFDYVHWDVIG